MGKVRIFKGYVVESLRLWDSGTPARRSLTPYARSVLVLAKKALIAADAEARRLANLKQGDEKPERLSSDERDNKGRTDEKLAKEVGIGKDTLRKIEYVEKNVPEEVKDKARSDKRDVSACLTSPVHLGIYHLVLRSHHMGQTRYCGRLFHVVVGRHCSTIGVDYDGQTITADKPPVLRVLRRLPHDRN